jgi:hypothetical protein
MYHVHIYVIHNTPGCILLMTDNPEPVGPQFFKQYTVHMDMKINMILEVDPIHDIVHENVVNFVMLTMGSRIEV